MQQSTSLISPSSSRHLLRKSLLRRINAKHWHYLTTEGDNLLSLIAEHAFNDLAVALLQVLPPDFSAKSLRPDGATPLIITALSGNLYLLEQLIVHPFGQAQINQTCRQGTTPLFIAMLRRDYRMAKILLDSGAHIDACLPDGSTPLMQACKLGDITMIKLLLSYSPNLHLNDQQHLSAFDHALYTNQCALLPLLHQHGAQLNKKGTDTLTPLMRSIQNNAPACALWLIENHADINQINHEGRSALMIAVINNRESVVLSLLKRPNLSINQIDDHQYTALMYACAHGHTEMVKQLIIHSDIDIYLSNTRNEMAITLATSNNFSDIVSLLLEQAFPLSRQDAVVLACLRNAENNRLTKVIDTILARMHNFYCSNHTQTPHDCPEINDYYKRYYHTHTPSETGLFSPKKSDICSERKKIIPIQKKPGKISRIL